MRRLPQSVRVLVGLAGTALAAAVLLGTRGAAVTPAAATHSSVAEAPAHSANSASGGLSASASGTVDGPVIDTRWGPVQVEVTVANGRITDVSALQTPTAHRHSVNINDRATPILREEVLTAQSADIDTVSGATVTSVAYAQSLQAALDQLAGS